MNCFKYAVFLVSLFLIGCDQRPGPSHSNLVNFLLDPFTDVSISNIFIVQPANKNKDLANQLGKCAGSYRFAALLLSATDLNNKTLMASSNISLNVANILTKTPLIQLKQIRDNEVANLTNEFEKITNTKDNQRIIAWGNSIGARNNACTTLISPLANKIQRDIDNAKK